MEDSINLSVWTLDRINAEQERHKIGALYVPIVDKDCFKECDLGAMDSITSAINKYMEKYQEENELYIICELAKRYVESQVPAEWIWTKYYNWICSNCGENPTIGMGYVQSKDNLYRVCPNCGRRMKNG